MATRHQCFQKHQRQFMRPVFPQFAVPRALTQKAQEAYQVFPVWDYNT